jgi:hypothetical protein
MRAGSNIMEIEEEKKNAGLIIARMITDPKEQYSVKEVVKFDSLLFPLFHM